MACAPVDLAMRAVTGDLACSFALNGCQNEQNVSVNSNALKLFKLLRVFRLLKLLRLFRVSRLLNRYQNTLIYCTCWGFPKSATHCLKDLKEE